MLREVEGSQMLPWRSVIDGDLVFGGVVGDIGGFAGFAKSMYWDYVEGRLI